jgi:hypothetical protein
MGRNNKNNVSKREKVAQVIVQITFLFRKMHNYGSPILCWAILTPIIKNSGIWSPSSFYLQF